MKTFKPLTAEEVVFSIEAEQEDMSVRGNYICSDDLVYDKQCEDEVLARLDNGDVWAWCCVRVTAIWGEWSEDTYLGGCSYENEEDFKIGSSDYYQDMQREALNNLNAKLAKEYACLDAHAQE